jgi:hypothetical protein
MAKMVRGCFDPFDRACLTRIKRSIHSIAQQINKSNDSVERGSKLMRNVREEFAFRSIGAEKLCREVLKLAGSIGNTAGFTTLK